MSFGPFLCFFSLLTMTLSVTYFWVVTHQFKTTCLKREHTKSNWQNEQLQTSQIKTKKDLCLDSTKKEGNEVKSVLQLKVGHADQQKNVKHTNVSYSPSLSRWENNLLTAVSCWCWKLFTILAKPKPIHCGGIVTKHNHNRVLADFLYSRSWR